MNPSLVAISGTLQGTAFELEEETSLGRDETNKIRVADLLASRRHCLISRNGNQYEITDLDSMNGTIVNGIPVRKRILQHGDRIDIGDSIFLFLLTDTEPDVQSVQVNDSLVARPTTRLRVEDTIYLNPERALGSPQVAAHIVAGFSTLLQISSVTNKVRSLEALSQKLLSLVFTAVPADRGALMVGENPDEYEAAFAFKRDGQVVSQPYLNRGIVCQVLRERLGILSNDVLENPTSGFDSGPTPATSLLVVPLMAFEKALGVIYLEIHDARVRFAEDHLHLMNAVASFAAPAVEHIRHLELLENENKRLQAEIEIDHRMIGESPDMRDLYQQIAKVSQTDSTVLIRGESGTGKELVAQALHR
ncbi:MAG TPA: FHA domain-containing protein, partial [Acidobacteriota bacterium]